MYTDFYGFTERPFDVNPDPKFLYLTESHRETLAAMLYGIKERRGFLAVTGEVGTGKTTLINALLNSLHDRVKVANIFRTFTTVQELLRGILYELGVTSKSRDRFTLWQRLNGYLLEMAEKGETVVLIIDEAQNLSSRMLEEIRILSNLETQKTKLLQIVLVGQPELEAKLNSAELRQLRQRIGMRRKLLPLTDEETKAYITHRLNLVGGKIDKVFAHDALSMVCRYAGGIPRVINITCDNAFLIGYALAKKKVDGGIIREVVKDMEGEASSPEEPLVTEATSVAVSAAWPGNGLVRMLRDFCGTLWNRTLDRLVQSRPVPQSPVETSGPAYTSIPARTRKETREAEPEPELKAEPGDVRVVEGIEYIYAKNRRYLANPYEPMYVWIRSDMDSSETPRAHREGGRG
jgi:general secretion pathway protein A